VEYGRQIAEMLRYLHSQDLVHSKLTPEKILITNDHMIKISDLRLNRTRRRRWDATRRRELDIAAYMSPEQYKEGASEKSDFYSLGVILFEMLTGKLPYPPDTLGRMTKMKLNSPVPSVATHMMNCPIWLDQIVTQMLSPDPRKRPHSARAIAMTFEEINNIAATKKAAVSQMAGGFNPLTVGQDKTEARRLLGMKKRKKKKVSDVPFYQRTGFQITALVAILGLTVFMMIPDDKQKIVDQARVMIDSEDSSEWTEARILLDPVIDGGGAFAETAEALYFEACRKTLVFRAENGQSNRLQSENVQLFGKGVRQQQDGLVDEACETFAELVAAVEPDGKERHIFFEAKERLEKLSELQELPVKPELLSELINKARNASSPSQLLRAHDLLVRITLEFAGVEGYQDIVATASEQLQILKKRIADGNSDKPEINGTAQETPE
ncbi:MAG: protein kinase, partial [Mariniblastus sp.]|nr:protein kinase [Mariniblastus sp.]